MSVSIYDIEAEWHLTPNTMPCADLQPEEQRLIADQPFACSRVVKHEGLHAALVDTAAAGPPELIVAVWS